MELHIVSRWSAQKKEWDFYDECRGADGEQRRPQQSRRRGSVRVSHLVRSRAGISQTRLLLPHIESMRAKTQSTINAIYLTQI